MSKIQKTKTGTRIVEGIEYNEYPAPESLIKAMESKWAKILIDDGAIRINSTAYYQQLESEELGDKKEGLGMFKLNGHPMEMSTGNEVFIWCAALPDTSYETLLSFSPSYDVIIEITDIREFTKRILSALREKGLNMPAHNGKIAYDRGEEVSKKELNSQKFLSNMFQKGECYQHQCEYRLSFTNVTFKAINENYIDIRVGNCSDLIKVVVKT